VIHFESLPFFAARSSSIFLFASSHIAASAASAVFVRNREQGNNIVGIAELDGGYRLP